MSLVDRRLEKPGCLAWVPVCPGGQTDPAQPRGLPCSPKMLGCLRVGEEREEREKGREGRRREERKVEKERVGCRERGGQGFCRSLWPPHRVAVGWRASLRLGPAYSSCGCGSDPVAGPCLLLQPGLEQEQVGYRARLRHQWPWGLGTCLWCRCLPFLEEVPGETLQGVWGQAVCTFDASCSQFGKYSPCMWLWGLSCRFQAPTHVVAHRHEPCSATIKGNGK